MQETTKDKTGHYDGKGDSLQDVQTGGRWS